MATNIDYRGMTIRYAVHEDGPEYGESVIVPHNDVDCDFNTIADAKEWIDEQLDTEDEDFNPRREWGTAGPF